MYHSHSVRILSVCPFLARSSILPLWLSSKYFRKHGSLDYSCRLQSLHSQFWRASVRHALKALWLHHKYSSKLPNLNFANIKIQPFFAISPNLMPAKFFPLYGIPHCIVVLRYPTLSHTIHHRIVPILEEYTIIYKWDLIQYISKVYNMHICYFSM